jgi:Tfp pilus assembly protein PilF
MSLMASSVSDALFATINQRGSQMAALASNALGAGIDKYQKKDYAGAINDFQRAIGMAPQSSNAFQAANYTASAYLQLDEPDNAIKAYKDSIRRAPDRDDTHIKLGNLFLQLERYDEAETEFKEAVRKNPHINNIYALGHLYLESGKYREAEDQFNKIVSMAPANGNGQYGLGLAYSKMERYEDAVEQLKDAIALKPDFAYGVADLGYAYADMGMIDEAMEQKVILEDMDATLADILDAYIYKTEAPKIEFASVEGTFKYTYGTNTPVSTLDSYLENANTSKPFTMVFQFGKEMDPLSVENRFNWNISRAQGRGLGGDYNFGQAAPETEVTIAPIPDLVVYDPATYRATLTFTVSQNSAFADGTIDPSHMVFKFSGTDKWGHAMDPDADEYMGFSGTM